MVRAIFNPTVLARVAASAVCMLPLSGHALSEQPLDMVYEPPQAARPRDGLEPVVAPLVARPCALVVQLADMRVSKTTLGGNIFMLAQAEGTPVVMQSIRGGDGLPWLRGAMRSLQTQGFSVAENAAETADPASAKLGMEVQLRLAQAWSVGLNLASTVVVEARYRVPAGDVTRTYVGQGMKANWANGDGEFMGVLNAAMADAVAALGQDAANLCEGRTLSASLP